MVNSKPLIGVFCLLPKWQSFLFGLMSLACSLSLTFIGRTASKFSVSLLAVQRTFGQLICFLPIIGIMALMIIGKLRKANLVIRLGSRAVLANYLLISLLKLTAIVTGLIVGIWLATFAVVSSFTLTMANVAAIINLTMNTLTACFTYTLAAIVIMLLVRSAAIGVLISLGGVISIYVLQLDPFLSLITPSLTLSDALWPIDVVKQLLLLIAVAEALRMVLNVIRLPAEV